MSYNPARQPQQASAQWTIASDSVACPVSVGQFPFLSLHRAWRGSAGTFNTHRSKVPNSTRFAPVEGLKPKGQPQRENENSLPVC